MSILNVAGAPVLTVSSLLSAIINNFGQDQACDEAFIAILPSGQKATPLNTTQTYMSTQLSVLLESIMLSLSTDLLNGDFLFLAQHGQMMSVTNESVQNLEKSLAARVIPRGLRTTEM